MLDIDGVRIREDAICRYLDDTVPDPALMPEDPKQRATANEAISLIPRRENGGFPRGENLTG